MLATDNRLAYVFTHREARRVLQLLERGPIRSYEQVRVALKIHPQEFQRIVHRLQVFDLVWARADAKVHWEGRRIRTALELSSKGRTILETLRAVDPILLAKRDALGPRTVDPLVS